MKKIRFLMALWAAKACRILMKVLGRNATYLPGKVAMKLCPDFLKQLPHPKTVIAVTGTNGKTTVSNLLSDLLKKNGYTVTNNSFGSNVQAGVVTALITDASLSGKAKKDIAVLEVDERSSLLIYPYYQPDFLLCNNIMRDSIKRNAHTGFISYIISSALPEKTRLILNADDLICATLGSQCKDRTYFGICANKPAENARQFLSDIVYCPQCGEKLESEYLRYNHIGRMYCPKCGLASPAPDFLVTEIDEQAGTFTLTHDGKELKCKLVNDNIVNVYNFCGAIALLSRLGISDEKIMESFEAMEIVKTRYEVVRSGDLNITMLMAKGQNPIACARCYDYVAKLPGDNKGLVIIVDDLGDNINNSESTCWLYDCDYSYLADPSIGQIVFGGPRSKDQYLRAVLSGVDPDKIRITDSSAHASDALDTDTYKDIYVLYELYRAPDAAVNKQALIARGGKQV
ncbi:MAG: DUF1727 domain-containing protein [Oscillospiraceae bacterium]|nr:DUF1727 domain-containing protein [Oscillospiraceae bacterium]